MFAFLLDFFSYDSRTQHSKLIYPLQDTSFEDDSDLEVGQVKPAAAPTPKPSVETAIAQTQTDKTTTTEEEDSSEEEDEEEEEEEEEYDSDMQELAQGVEAVEERTPAIGVSSASQASTETQPPPDPQAAKIPTTPTATVTSPTAAAAAAAGLLLDPFDRGLIKRQSKGKYQVRFGTLRNGFRKCCVIRFFQHNQIDLYGRGVSTEAESPQLPRRKIGGPQPRVEQSPQLFDKVPLALGIPTTLTIHTK